MGSGLAPGASAPLPALFAATPFAAMAVLAALGALLLAAAVTDARQGRIPDWATGGIALLALLVLALAAPAALPGRLLDAGLVGALLLALRAFHRRRRGVAGLGLGDVKLLAAATLWLGLPALFLALLLASLAALAVLAGLKAGGRPVGRGTRLRFGPYLAAAILAVLLFDGVYGV